MSLLTRPVPSRASASVAPLQSPLALGGLAAVQAVVGSLLCLVAPVLGVWIASTRTDASWGDTVRLAADAWLLAHHAGIAVDGGHVGLVPLGLTALPAAWCWAAGRRMGILLGLSAGRDPTPSRAAPPGALATGRAPRRALAAFTAAYAVLAAVVSLLAASPVARPLSGQALLGGAAVAAAAGGLAMLRACRPSSEPLPWSPAARRLHLPAVVRRTLPAAAVAVAGWLAAASALLAVALVLGREGVLAATTALGAGPVGGIGLLLVQLAYLPVAVVWAGAWLAGPGFAVGAGTAVNPWYADLGALPALPVLGALPSGVLPGPVPALLLVPVLAGVLAGTYLRRRRAAPAARRWWDRALVDGGTCGLLAGAGAGLLSWLASGPAGPGRMAVTGPEPGLVAAAVAAQVALGCAAVLALPARRDRQPSAGRPAGVSGRPPSWLRSWIQRS